MPNKTGVKLPRVQGKVAAAGPKPDPTARAFKTKAFARLARKDGLADEELCKAVRELEEGKGDDLGGNVWKKRVDSSRHEEAGRRRIDGGDLQ